MDNQRFILFIALSVIILLLWTRWESEHRPAPALAPQAIPAAPSAPGVSPGQTAAGAATKPFADGERIQVDTDLVHAVIDTSGGDLRVLDLRKYPVSADKPNTPFKLLDDEGTEIFVAQSGLIAREGVLPNHRTLYTAEARHYELAPDQQQLEVRLNWTGPNGVRVAKIYTFHRNDYRVDITYEINNTGHKTREVYQYAQWLRHHVDEKRGLTSLPSYTGGVIYTEDKRYEKIAFSHMADHPLARNVEGGWVAMIEHYFLGVWLPGKKEQHQFYSEAQPGQFYVLGYKTLTPVTVAPGQKATLSTSLFAGPKEQARLGKIDQSLKLTVDYGWLTFIAVPLYWILEWMHKLVGNWGWAIILLTMLIKGVFYPLSRASYRSMAQMRKMQPRMQAIKERYGDDRQKMNQAMMELYKTEKINPLGGCLPILVQIPVFISLYWVLLESIELRQAPFMLWIRDLSAPDPYFVLPIIMGLSMLAQQWLNPQPMDPMQKKLMYAMPVVFMALFLFFPAGLVLYWVVQNLLSIAQQWSINRSVEGKAK
jgi:YidC/Oxa1 family membrane protein insertase